MESVMDKVLVEQAFCEYSVSLSNYSTDCFIALLLSFNWLCLWRDWVHFVHQSRIALLYQLRMTQEYGTFGGMKIGRGNQSSMRNSVPERLYPLQITHQLRRDRIRSNYEVSSSIMTIISIILHRSQSLAYVHASLLRSLNDKTINTVLYSHW
jgi:hypothetical protein